MRIMGRVVSLERDGDSTDIKGMSESPGHFLHVADTLKIQQKNASWVASLTAPG